MMMQIIVKYSFISHNLIFMCIKQSFSNQKKAAASVLLAQIFSDCFKTRCSHLMATVEGIRM